jgi:ankyrin repeat protein
MLLAMDSIDLNPMDKFGCTPLLRAARRGKKEVVQMLLAKGNIDLNPVDKGGETPLLWAVQEGYNEIVKMLLAMDSIDPNPVDDYGDTPLIRAIKTWCYWNAEEKKEVIEMLLANDGIDLNFVGRICGRTPLILAITEGYPDIAKLLLSMDSIDPNLADTRKGRTPLFWAEMRGYKEISRYFSRKMVSIPFRWIDLVIHLGVGIGLDAISGFGSDHPGQAYFPRYVYMLRFIKVFSNFYHIIYVKFF